MTDIQRILSTGLSERGRGEPIPTEQQIRDVESQLEFCFPTSYREFVRLGGLNELRLNHRVLGPFDIVQSRRYLPDGEHIPFADNGCGDLYCWPRTEAVEPNVVFADHETGTYSPASESFIKWLEENKF